MKNFDILKYENLCHKIVHKVLRKCDHSRLYEDCMQEARIALIEADDKYLKERGTTFTTYATYILRTRVQEFLASQRYPISMSTYTYRTLQKFFAIEGEGFKTKQLKSLNKLKALLTMDDISDIEI